MRENFFLCVASASIKRLILVADDRLLLIWGVFNIRVTCSQCDEQANDEKSEQCVHKKLCGWVFHQMHARNSLKKAMVLISVEEMHRTIDVFKKLNIMKGMDPSF